MPIRSPHGRAAAYRALWQWPLRSPKRLAVSVLVVVALGAGLSHVMITTTGGTRTSGAAGATAGPSTPAATGPTVTALPPVPDLKPTTLPLSRAPAAALDVARRWTRAWVRPPDGTTNRQWLESLRPVTTDEYLGVLSTVDPTNIPATKVTGSARPVQVATRSVRVEVPTDGPTLLVLVVNTETGWRVAGYERV